MIHKKTNTTVIFTNACTDAYTDGKRFEIKDCFTADSFEVFRNELAAQFDNADFTGRIYKK